MEATEARRLASRLRFACLPAPWRIADFSAQPGVDASLKAASTAFSRATTCPVSRAAAWRG